jgi:diguanylate cyclase (GGDEF)-like protein
LNTVNASIVEMRYYLPILLGLTLAMLVIIRQYIIIAENRHLYHEMERLATIDQLTGLNNRRSFDQAIEIESQRARRFNHPYAVLMMDVDNFKHYNDCYGHLAGDIVLKSVATLLRSKLRAADFIARFGGDEFVAILPETDFNGAIYIAGKLAAAAKEHFHGESLGLSVGAAVWNPDITSQQVLDAADQELYRVKPHRR